MAILAQDLREAILQAAFQGKLTKQIDTDTSVFKLIENFKEIKESLIRDRKILRKSPTEPFYTEGNYPFEIPDNWIWVQLSDVSIIQEGAGIRKYQYRDSGTQLLCVTNILNKGIDLDIKKIYVSDEEYKEKYSHLTPQIGDLVTACSGGSYGKVAIYDKDDIVMLNTSVLRMRFFNDLSNNKYLYHIVKSNFFKLQLDSQLSGMQPNFGYAHYSRIVFPLPPIEEQVRIVAKIEEIMSKIDEYEKIENQLESIKKAFPMDMRDALLQAAMQGKLTEQLDSDSSVDDLIESIKVKREKLVAEGKIKKSKGKSTQYNVNFVELEEDDKPFEIPSSWKLLRLGSFEEINLGFTYKPNYTSSGVKFLSVKDISSGKIDFSKTQFISRETYNNASYGSKPHKGDILFGRVGTLGKPQIIETDDEFCIFVSLGFLRDHTNIINKKYICYWMESPIFWSQIYKKVKGSTVKNLNTTWLEDFLVPMPSLEEQERIVKVLNYLLPLCETL